MGFINLGRLNIRKRNSCASALVSLSDVQPPSVYKSHILNGPINKLYILYKSAPGNLVILQLSVLPYTRRHLNEGTWRGHPCAMDRFLVYEKLKDILVLFKPANTTIQN